MIERPLDLLNELKGKKVVISFKDGQKEVETILLAFDIHINVAIEDAKTKQREFIRGDTILGIKEK